MQAENAKLKLQNAQLLRELDEKTLQLAELRRVVERDASAFARDGEAERDSTQSWVAILDALPVSIALVDAEGVIVAVNAEWRRFATVNALDGPRSGVGRNYLAICEQANGECSEDAREVAMGIRRVLQGEQSAFVMEYPCHAPDERRWFRLMVSPVHGQEYIRALIMHVNITEQKLSELAARDSEQRLDFALGAARVGDWTLDLRTNVAHRSLRHDQCFGYSQLLSEWGYDTFLAHVDPADRERVRACFENAMKGGGEYDAEFRTTWPDGSVHWLWTRGRFYSDESGSPSRVSGIVTEVSERKEAEMALRRVLERLTEAQRIGRIGDWEWDIATQKISWSAEVFDIVGRDERLGPPRSFDEQNELFDEASRSLLLEKVTRAIESGEEQQYDLVVHHPRGERVLVHATALPRLDESGAVTGLYGTIQDISTLRRTEASLSESEQRLVLASESARIGIWDWNVVTDTMSWDRQMFALYGIKDPDFSGAYSAWQNGLHPEDRERAEGEVTAALAGSREFHSDFRVRWPNGETRHIEAHALVQRGGDGSPVRMIGVNWDITERKRNETRIRRLMESNAQGVLFWNSRGEITGANEAFLAMTRYTREDLDSGLLKWSEMTPPEYAHLDHRALEEIATRGVCTPFEKEYLRKDGSRLPIIVGAAAFDDGPEEGVCFVVDLTERKKLEHEFLRAQRLESIGTLAGGIAHDLNNVFAPIIMSLDLLEMEFPERDGQETISVIRASAQHGAEMVRQVLSFARGLEGRRMEVQIGHLVSDIQKIVRDTFPKDIHMRAGISGDLWLILGDPTQLHQVLLNLCVNARDAMPDGGNLIISAENRILDAQYAALNLEAAPGPYVFLEIEDTGTGMLPDIIDRIFDPYFTTKGVGKGTGLGLATSMAIIKSHGGFLRVYSEPGRGTRFQCYLPAQVGTASDSVAKIRVEMPRGNDELILVVDDEPSVRQITQQTLQAFGYRVILACDGAEAIAIYADRRAEIDAVLTDMTMPVMDGPAVVRVLRKMSPNLPIIAASGLSASAQSSQVASLGVEQFLSKPYTADTLLKALRAVLSAERIR